MPKFESSEQKAHEQERTAPMEKREEIFVNWLQHQITAPIKDRMEKQKLEKRNGPLRGWFTSKQKATRLKERFSKTERAAAYLASDEMKGRLKLWQPWKLDEQSIKNGKNLYIKVAKGYSDKRFMGWVKKEAGDLGISEDELLAGVIETARLIAWETIKSMAARGLATTYVLPHVIIGEEPRVDVMAFGEALKKAKHTRQTAGLFSKKEAEKLIDPFGILTLFPYRIQQMMAPLRGGPLNLGTQLENKIALYSPVLKASFQKNATLAELTLSPYIGRDMTSLVVEEEIHHQGYREKELKELTARYHEESKTGGASAMDILKIQEIGQKAEKEVGIHALVDEIMKELPPQEKLFAPFYQRTRRESQNSHEKTRAKIDE